MISLRTVPYEEWHIDAMVLRAHEAVNTTKENLNGIMQNGIAITLMSDEEVPVAILCYFENATGYLNVFVLPSIFVSQFSLPFYRATKRYIRSTIKSIGADFRRMETRSLDDAQTNKWMSRLGFVCEGTHPKFAPDGSTYKTWAVVA